MDEATEKTLREIYAQARTIAVVGASTDPAKPSYRMPAYMQTQGYRIIPVTPKGGEIFGEKAAADLSQIEGSIDIVNVFRPSEETPAIAEQAVKVGAKVLWLQAGISSAEAERIAQDGGLLVVMDRCIAVTHGRLGLGPGPN